MLLLRINRMFDLINDAVSGDGFEKNLDQDHGLMVVWYMVVLDLMLIEFVMDFQTDFSGTFFFGN
jgi:hypothetical protein